jgi:hypothetical protein
LRHTSLDGRGPIGSPPRRGGEPHWKWTERRGPLSTFQPPVIQPSTIFTVRRMSYAEAMAAYDRLPWVLTEERKRK